MGLKQISCLIFIIWISGCASASSSRKSTIDESRARTFAEVYRQSKKAPKTADATVLSLALNPFEGYVKPYVPVIQPPRVIKVWIPAHVLREDKSVMVAGHWSFVMLEATRWFIEGEENKWH